MRLGTSAPHPTLATIGTVAGSGCPGEGGPQVDGGNCVPLCAPGPVSQPRTMLAVGPDVIVLSTETEVPYALPGYAKPEGERPAAPATVGVAARAPSNARPRTGTCHRRRAGWPNAEYAGPVGGVALRSAGGEKVL